MKKYDLLTLGEILLRFSPPSGERLDRSETLYNQVGGAELNVACGAALLGLKTGVIAKLPDNSLSDYAKRTMRALGVSTEYLALDTDPDARLGIYYYEGGAAPKKPSVVYDRLHTSARKINLSDYDAELYRSARMFHTSGITLALGEGPRGTAIAMMKKFKEQGALISFDVNFRGNLWSGAEAKAVIEEILPLVDVFFCSESTAILTFGKSGRVEDMLKEFATEYDIAVVAATQRIVHSPKEHTFGSVIYDAKNDCFHREEPYEHIEVVDRIGSGDSYVSGVLAGLLATDLDCETALRYGNAAGALKNTVPGDLPAATKAELTGIIKDHQNKGYQLEMNR